MVSPSPRPPQRRLRTIAASNLYHTRALHVKCRSNPLRVNLFFIFIASCVALLFSAARRIPRPVQAAPSPSSSHPRTHSLSRHINPTVASLAATLKSLQKGNKSSKKFSFTQSKFPVRRDGHPNNLPEPKECSTWRRVARIPSKLNLYRAHFNSHDIADWFLYTAIFNETWHERQRTRPVYVDIAANHARRWSTTWFFDRCMGWDGVCVEPNNIYWSELRRERHCRLVSTCLSDRARSVNFSFTAAFGGVVARRDAIDETQRLGVDGVHHSTASKYAQHFNGIREIQCETLDTAIRERNDDITNRRRRRQQKVSHFDFMSLDVEGHELPILQGINWKNTVIDVIVTENRGGTVKQMLVKQGYDHYPKVLKDDVWIRQKSGLSLNPTIVSWMRSFNQHVYKFKNVSGDETDDDENDEVKVSSGTKQAK